MHSSSNQGIEGHTFVVTGGLGFVGSHLCVELIRRGALQVRALDLRTTSPWSQFLTTSSVQIIPGDITNKEDVNRALSGVDCVFHLASYGMSGKEMLQFGHVEKVNVFGTCNVVDACVEHGISRLVYVSTYNVVFGGREIINGNESLPYLPIADQVDSYGSSKSISEQWVLKSNGRTIKKKKLNSGECLYTCAVRPAAIYGPGEERHLPRIIFLAKWGLLPFKIGKPTVLSDWVYVDNLVLALILAATGLHGSHPIAAGQAYFISDGFPVNTFEFLRPLLRSLEYDMPKASLDVNHALIVGNIFKVIYTIFYPWLDQKWLPQPLILPSEVNKVGVTHYFSFHKAARDIGYVPIVSHKEGMSATIAYWQERKMKTLDGPTIYAWLFSLVGMFTLFSLCYFPDVGPMTFIRALGLFIFRSIWMLRTVFFVSVALHVGEAIYAWRLAKKVDPSNARGWFFQTFALGIFSLRFLLKRAQR